jgi:sirohydrochlorin ferrochelatase
MVFPAGRGSYYEFKVSSSMKALVLIAHGSRRQASNEEVIALSGVIAREMKDDYPIVEAGFLELAEPSIPEALDRCVRQGATDICIVPYFLSAGRHVHEDIPGEVDKVRTMHANIPMTIVTHIGGSPQMKDLIRGVVMKCGHSC